MTISRKFIKPNYKPFYVVGENETFGTLKDLKRRYGIKELTRTGREIEILKNGRKFIYDKYKTL